MLPQLISYKYIKQWINKLGFIERANDFPELFKAAGDTEEQFLSGLGNQWMSIVNTPLMKGSLNIIFKAT